jgi:N-acetylglutamate synthase-like GNAT family acetyltransferase
LSSSLLQEDESKRFRIVPVSIRDLPTLYAVYFAVFPGSSNRGALLESMQKKSGMPDQPRALVIYLLHIILGRLETARNKGSLRALFQSRWDMVPYLICEGGEVVGCCFLLSHDPRVMEIGIIGVVSSVRGRGVGARAVKVIKQYAATKGVTRIVVRASGLRDAAGFFLKSGFRSAYSERTFSIKVDEDEIG